jgi:signal peptidase II
MNIASLLHRGRLALPVALVLATADFTTKQLAIQRLSPAHVPHEVFGTTLRFTLGYNREAVMGLPVNPRARALLVVAPVAVTLLLLRLLWGTPPRATIQRLALGLILGGAIGNLLSRVLSTRGVVDFIDVGLGARRFYTFNVADAGIWCGAALLAFALWRDRAGTSAVAPPPAD